MGKRIVVEQKMNSLFGVLVRSTVSKGKISNIIYPRDLDDYFIITSEDMSSSNRIRVVDSYIPILSTNEVSYVGQPILAVFGYDYESAKLFADEIKIEYTDVESAMIDLPTVNFGWGDTQPYLEDSSCKKINSIFLNSPIDSDAHLIMRVKANIVGENIHIEAPTQWPYHLREAVSSVLASPKKNIKLTSTSGTSATDEYLIRPTVLACIAAVTAKKTGLKTQIISCFPTTRPEIIITRNSILDKDGNYVAEDIFATADLGAYPMFHSELAQHLICGLMPMYPVPNLSIKVQTLTSNRVPSNFFGSLGYPTALASTEVQMTKIANAFGQSPASFRQDLYATEGEYSKHIQTPEMKNLKDLLQKITDKSSFNRKHFAFEHLKHNKNKLNSLLNQPRGIGIGCSPGIAGFTNHFPYLTRYKLKLTYTEDKKVIINTSFPQKSSFATISQSYLSQNLNVDINNISFLDPQSMDMVDTGPNVLNRDIGNIPMVLAKTTKLLQQKIENQEPFPIEASIDHVEEENDPSFKAYAWVAVVIELAINPVLLVPVVKNCWVNMSFGGMFNQNSFESHIRRILETTIVELGGTADKEMVVNISYSSKNNEQYSVIHQALQGAVTGAFTTALTQALNINQVKIPVTSEHILEVIKKTAYEN